jgi:hypothetical protein
MYSYLPCPAQLTLQRFAGEPQCALAAILPANIPAPSVDHRLKRTVLWYRVPRDGKKSRTKRGRIGSEERKSSSAIENWVALLTNRDDIQDNIFVSKKRFSFRLLLPPPIITEAKPQLLVALQAECRSRAKKAPLV